MKGNSDGMYTSPFSLKGNGDGMDTSLSYLKVTSDGMATSASYLKGNSYNIRLLKDSPCISKGLTLDF